MSSTDLRIFLVINKISINGFAKMMGVSRQAVNCWINDIHRIPQRVIDFCKNYGRKYKVVFYD